MRSALWWRVSFDSVARFCLGLYIQFEVGLVPCWVRVRGNARGLENSARFLRFLYVLFCCRHQII
jgi:hypothetical protein